MNKSALDDLLAFIRFRSVSTDPAYKADVDACAEWVCAFLKDGGLESRLFTTPGHPIVVASTPKRPNRPTLLIYGHYDVQPVDPLELWHSDPFEPTVADGIITARGATDNKGQIMAHIRGVLETLAEKSECPVNVVFLIEGEEEIGSQNLEPFLEEHREMLACDVVAVSDTGMVAPGVPTMTYGLRGIAAMEITLRGPEMDLHSGMFGGTIMNPATAAARIAASLHDPEERVRIPGFYDRVKPLADWERKEWSALPLNDEAFLRMTGVSALVGEVGYTGVERVAGRPTAEVNGIAAGYQGAGTKTVIPSEAMIKLTFRLVPDQDPQAILEAAEAHIRRVTPSGITLHIERGHSAAAYYTDPHSDLCGAARRALRVAWGREPVLIREGGSIPIVQSFKTKLGVDTLLLGLALPDCRAHSPNETFPIESYEKGIHLNKALLEELASV
ncbi:MAG: dipeptidase [Verrucomicrobiia bacterium]